jgi:hypothetical protein
VTVRAASDFDPGATIEFRSGSPTGPILATVKVPKTGGKNKYQEQTADLTPPAKSSSIHLVFQSPIKGRLMFLDWIEFK